jgi:excisionase family DNA binding protein
MPPQAPKPDPVELFEVDICALPSVLQQIVELAHLRDPSTGAYTHPSVPSRSRAEEVHDKLRRLHERAFRHWLQMGLEAQKADFDIYVSGLSVPQAKVVETWRTLEMYRCLVPASASPAERELFVSDMEVMLLFEQHAEDHRQTPQPMASLGPARDDEILTIKEVAGWLRLAARTLRQWAEVGIIPAFKLGRQWRFRRTDIENWLRGGADRKKIAGQRH